jgi:hypothetical protein
MALPVLDRDNFAHESSEWVLHAGRALRDAGYLHSEPSGSFDEEFAEAVRAFQADKGIHEEDRIGPFTWDALGVRDEETRIGAVSEDGQWQWDGTAWVAADAASVVASVVASVTADVAADIAPVAAGTAETGAGQLSEDGLWRWDGAEWTAVAGAASPDAQSVARLGSLVAAHGVSESEDAEIAGAVVDLELAILRHWKSALDSFNEVMESETTDSAKPKFAEAMLAVFAEKVLGSLAEDSKSTFVFSLLKGALAEGRRAIAADLSVRFRDFYTQHLGRLDKLDASLADGRLGFVTAVRVEGERLVRENPDSYGMLRMELVDLHDEVRGRHSAATPEALFALLSAEWTRQSVNRISWNASEAAEIRVRIREADLSIVGVKINAPDGDKLVDHMSGQDGGMDLWHLQAPKLIMFLDEGSSVVGYVRLDAANQLGNLPAEQDAHYRRRYQRLVDAGGLAPYRR